MLIALIYFLLIFSLFKQGKNFFYFLNNAPLIYLLIKINYLFRRNIKNRSEKLQNVKMFREKIIRRKKSKPITLQSFFKLLIIYKLMPKFFITNTTCFKKLRKERKQNFFENIISRVKLCCKINPQFFHHLYKVGLIKYIFHPPFLHVSKKLQYFLQWLLLQKRNHQQFFLFIHHRKIKKIFYLFLCYFLFIQKLLVKDLIYSGMNDLFNQQMWAFLSFICILVLKVVRILFKKLFKQRSNIARLLHNLFIQFIHKKFYVNKLRINEALSLKRIQCEKFICFYFISFYIVLKYLGYIQAFYLQFYEQLYKQIRIVSLKKVQYFEPHVKRLRTEIKIIKKSLKYHIESIFILLDKLSLQNKQRNVIPLLLQLKTYLTGKDKQILISDIIERIKFYILFILKKDIPQNSLSHAVIRYFFDQLKTIGMKKQTS